MKIIKNAEKIFKDIIDTLKKKNADYTGDRNEFDNFIRSAQMANVSVEQSIMVRLTDKMSRLSTLACSERDAQVADEKITDTILDAIGYLIILYAWLEAKKDYTITSIKINYEEGEPVVVDWK